MTLIHTALLCEAQAIIEEFKLEKISPKIYKNNKILILISGIGEKNTIKNLNKIFTQYNFTKAFNVGIAGSKDKNIKIGEIFCTNKKIDNIKFTEITTVKKPTKNIKTTLVDMESSAFLLTCKYFKVDCFVLKIVSDYLDDTILEKKIVINLIRESLKKWKHLI